MEHTRLGGFLVERGVVTASAVVEALGEQARLKPPIGRLAMKLDLLDVKEVFAVLNAQVVSKLRFGQQAVALGLIGEADVLNLLEAQAQATPRLGELLVQAGTLDQASLERELLAFERIRHAPSAKMPVAARAPEAETKAK